MFEDQQHYIEQAEVLRGMNCILIGPPGSGKSTLVENLQVLNPDITYISVGEITRQHIEAGGVMAERIAQLYKDNQPWPDEFMIELIRPTVLRHKDSGFILDGIPRKHSEVYALVKVLADNKIKLDLTLDIFTDRETCLKRIQERISRLGERPDKFTHYQTRLDMYWGGIEEIKSVLSELSNMVSINTSNSPKEVLTTLLDNIN